MIRETDRLGFYAVGMLFLLALAMVATAILSPARPRRAPQSEMASHVFTTNFVQPTEHTWQSIRNQASVESFTTMRIPGKKSRGLRSSRKCTATFASMLLDSTTAARNSANQARRTARRLACRVAGFGRRASKQTSKFAERSSRAQDIGACVLMQGDTIASPARACGARASRESGVARLTGGFSGPTGFDTERESEAIVQAVSVRFEQLATPNCERQRGLRSSCGLTDVGAQDALVAHRCKPTRDRSRHSASAAQIQRMVEGFRAPSFMGCQRAQNAGYARERTSEATFVDRGSIPRGSTHSKQLSKRVVSAQQQESATRLASVDDLASRSTGSAPAQPELIGGVS